MDKGQVKDPAVAEVATPVEVDSLVAKAAALRAQLAELDRELGAQPIGPDDLVAVQMNIAPYSNYIQIMGKQYLHNMSYMVEQGTAGILHEQMRRSWQHEGTLREAENPLRKQHNQVVR